MTIEARVVLNRGIIFSRNMSWFVQVHIDFVLEYWLFKKFVVFRIIDFLSVARWFCYQHYYKGNSIGNLSFKDASSYIFRNCLMLRTNFNVRYFLTKDMQTPPPQFWSDFYEWCAMCLNEWKIKFPIFIFRVIAKIPL